MRRLWALTAKHTGPALFRGRLPFCAKELMKQSEIYRQNAENCAYLAEGARDEQTGQRYKRMEAA